MDEPPRFRQSSRKFARAQRQNMTGAETMLRRAVRNHQIDGHGFRRQTPIGPYFADFVCLARKIVVEADGRTRETAGAKIKDADRDAWFRRAGFRVLRFPDELIIGGLRSSSSAFVRRCARHELPPSPRSGEGVAEGDGRGCGKRGARTAGSR
jgi:very-short-patch-repair endonuclease